MDRYSDTINLESLGTVVREARQAVGLTARDLAQIAGCRDRWIERLELGLVELPHAATLGCVTDTLRLNPVEVDWLSGGQLEGWYPGLVTWFRPGQLSASAALIARRLFIRRRQAGLDRAAVTPPAAPVEPPIATY